MRRALDEPVREALAYFVLVECERCGLLQANELATRDRDDDPFAAGCFACGHEYARFSPHHAEAVASIRWCLGSR